MKLMNAIAISPVIIKVIPNPFNGAGTCAYLILSLIAAKPTIASNQPIPLPSEKENTSPILAYSLCCINNDAPMIAQFTAINGKKIPNWL